MPTRTQSQIPVLAVIMARGGSVGLPGKSLRPLLGRPVISYTFDHARSSETLTRTVVSTDCPGVKSLAIRSGFGVIDRPPHLATSDASVQDVMLHALRMVESDGEFSPDAQSRQEPIEREIPNRHRQRAQTGAS